jgi:7-cyano-7-deazaguanine synthase in queuosine biosynthesis
MRHDDDQVAVPSLRVDVVEAGQSPRSGYTACEIGGDLRFTTEHLESYCLARWEPILFDALVLAGAVEFCDRLLRRRTQHWGRSFELRVPVHDPARWNAASVNGNLKIALEFLTGDQWEINFVPRNAPAHVPHQLPFELFSDTRAVIPFSDGLDSRAVAGLMHREIGEGLIRVRLGTKEFQPVVGASGKKQPFTSIPYRVKPKIGEFVESSARSRGFKFSLVSGIAAYVVHAQRIIVTESGQGSLGPVLVAVGQGYEDYRSYPLFMDRMEVFLKALFNHSVKFEFPRLWHTKGETLAAFVRECADGASWNTTWSCWQQNRHSSVDGRKRQCGICAACMLRRLSVHAAGLSEAAKTYVWESLSACTFESGAAQGFTHITKAQRDYAIAGTLHLDHLATVQKSPMNKGMIDLTISQVSRSRGLSEDIVRGLMTRLLNKHESEWMNFLDALGPDAFVANWVARS